MGKLGVEMKHVTMFAKGLDQNKTADIRGIAGAKADQAPHKNAAGIGCGGFGLHERSLNAALGSVILAGSK